MLPKPFFSRDGLSSWQSFHRSINVEAVSCDFGLDTDSSHRSGHVIRDLLRVS